ncbi:MAG: cyclodeaminase/cyclohydrolase family protein [Salinibacterium sp.]|nr:cyclodeaminase/cyclohydrolase family protein [Salinibacterium sp.]
MATSEQPQIHTRPIGNWLEALADKSPTPGGGSVAALVGAVAAALGSMVVAYTQGKKSFADAECFLDSSAAKLSEARLVLLSLADRDAHAYAILNELMRLPEDDPKRIEGWENAVQGAIGVPRAGVVASVSLAGILEDLAGKSNPWLGSDLAIAAELAAAAASAFAWNVRVNLPQLEASDQTEVIGRETDELVAKARGHAERTARVVLDVTAG